MPFLIAAVAAFVDEVVVVVVAAAAAVASLGAVFHPKISLTAIDSFA